MGSLSVSFVFLGVFTLILHESKGDNTLKEFPIDKQHHIQNSEVKKLLQEQVSAELNASLVYLTMAAHFGNEKKNRPGFNQFFAKCAQEEFEHAQMFISYMNKRGVPLVKENFKMENPSKFTWKHGLEALEEALKMEGEVTVLIKRIHEKADGDGHLTNFLESEFLEEQVDSMRRLSGYVHNLRSMAVTTPPAYDMLSEYLFDLQLQGKKLEL
uniref:Ferritin n=1 Tax=Hemiscolopendra marginata TaxID=943146 RepID=A0A646QFV0_9MYRI